MSYEDLKNRLLEANDCDNIECVREFNALREVIKLCDKLDANGNCCLPIKDIKQIIEKELL